MTKPPPPLISSSVLSLQPIKIVTWLVFFILWATLFIGIGIIGDWVHNKRLVLLQTQIEEEQQQVLLQTITENNSIQESSRKEQSDFYPEDPFAVPLQTKVKLTSIRFMITSFLQLFTLWLGIYMGLRMIGIKPKRPNFLQTFWFFIWSLILCSLIMLTVMLTFLLWFLVIFWLESKSIPILSSFFVEDIHIRMFFYASSLFILIGTFLWMGVSYFLSHFGYTGHLLLQENIPLQRAMSVSKKMGGNQKAKLFLFYVCTGILTMITMLPLLKGFSELIPSLGANFSPKRPITQVLLSIVSAPLFESLSLEQPQRFLYLRLLLGIGIGSSLFGVTWLYYKQTQEKISR